MSLPNQTGRPASAPIERYGVDGPRIVVGHRREALGASLALQGDGRAQSLPIDFTRQQEDGRAQSLPIDFSRQGGGALHIVDVPTTSGRPFEAAFQARQQPQVRITFICCRFFLFLRRTDIGFRAGMIAQYFAFSWCYYVLHMVAAKKIYTVMQKSQLRT